MILKSFYINGIKVEFTTFGVKIYTADEKQSLEIRRYLIDEGLILSKDKIKIP